MSVQTKLLSPT